MNTAQVRPEVPITLDKERHLRLDLNAMVTFEEATGKNLCDPQVLDDLKTRLSLKNLRALLYACLLHEDKTLTLEQVGGWIHAGNMAEIISSTGRAFQVALPKPEKGAAGGRPLARKSPAG